MWLRAAERHGRPVVGQLGQPLSHRVVEREHAAGGPRASATAPLKAFATLAIRMRVARADRPPGLHVHDARAVWIGSPTVALHDRDHPRRTAASIATRCPSARSSSASGAHQPPSSASAFGTGRAREENGDERESHAPRAVIAKK